MPEARLPERASLEYLKKLAKDRLRKLRRAQPATQLAKVQLAIAREQGFASWSALKTEVEKRQKSELDLFFEAAAMPQPPSYCIVPWPFGPDGSCTTRYLTVG